MLSAGVAYAEPLIVLANHAAYQSETLRSIAEKLGAEFHPIPPMLDDRWLSDVRWLYKVETETRTFEEVMSDLQVSLG